MRLSIMRTLIGLPLLSLAFAQSNTQHQHSSNGPSQTASANTSASAASNSSVVANNTASSNFSHTVLTTTLTTFPTTTVSDGTPSPSILTLTLTLPVSDLSAVNASIANGTYTNGTMPANATQNWKNGDNWIPFKIALDPAYGLAGGFLILTGIPVAVLGGKNRWSSLAISSGLAVLLFTLVLILRFGVQPSLAEPSPHPPTHTLRGLYFFACLVTSLIGAGLGIFFYNFTKYAVSAGGGFVFAWFLLATKSGGLIGSMLGRWGLLGGLTVTAFIASLPKWSNEYMTLFSTTWVGATAFVLGVDCFTKAGLKEFYMYNLGFREIFPKLDGGKYPLTQTMTIELGILGAVVLIGAAIQFRVLNVLTKRFKQAREEEEARIEAEEISRAAERFKNVGVELAEWEEKHGNDPKCGVVIVKKEGRSSPVSFVQVSNLSGYSMRADRSSELMPQLGFDDSKERDEFIKSDNRASSTLSLLTNDPLVAHDRSSSSISLDRVRDTNDPRGVYETVNADTPTSSMFLGIEELKPERLVENAETKGDSLEEQLKLLEEVKRARESIRGSLEALRSRTSSDPHFISSASESSSHGDLDGLQRRVSSTSTRPIEVRLRTVSTPALVHSSPPEQERPRSEWDSYLAERKIIIPKAVSSPGLANNINQNSSYINVPVSVAKGIEARREKTRSMLEPKVSDFEVIAENNIGDQPRRALHEQDYSHPANRQRGYRYSQVERPSTYHDQIDSGIPLRPQPSHQPHSSYDSNGMVYGYASDRHQTSGNYSNYRPMSKTLSIDELGERHRKRLSKLQEPVTARLREPEELEEVKKKWERQKAMEGDEMRQKERQVREQSIGKGRDKEEVLRMADEWRRSVVMDHQPSAQRSGATGGQKADKRQSRIVN
ncbi:hypothetical protein L204_100219 [Cryptococcus depauperatus]